MPGFAPPVTDDRTALTAYPAHQRRALRATAHSLTTEQGRMAATAGELSIGGLVSTPDGASTSGPTSSFSSNAGRRGRRTSRTPTSSGSPPTKAWPTFWPRTPRQPSGPTR
jgi:hypothetical protein